jgi:copper(I)-binding protein
MNTIKTGLLTTTLLSCLCMLQAVQAESPIAIDSAWIREAPPATSVLAAYMTINNASESDQQITGMDSPDFRSAEIPLREGDTATLVVHTASGAAISVQATVVRKTGDDAGHDHSHHHH